METKINGQEIPQLKMTSRSHYILFQFLTCLFRGLCFIPVKLWAKSDQFNLKKNLNACKPVFLHYLILHLGYLKMYLRLFYLFPLGTF